MPQLTTTIMNKFFSGATILSAFEKYILLIFSNAWCLGLDNKFLTVSFALWSSLCLRWQHWGCQQDIPLWCASFIPLGSDQLWPATGGKLSWVTPASLRQCPFTVENCCGQSLQANRLLSSRSAQDWECGQELSTKSSVWERESTLRILWGARFIKLPCFCPQPDCNWPIPDLAEHSAISHDDIWSSSVRPIRLALVNLRSFVFFVNRMIVHRKSSFISLP